MIRRHKSSILSGKLRHKRNLRKRERWFRKIRLIMFPIALISLTTSIWLVITLIGLFKDPVIISPLSNSTRIISPEDNFQVRLEDLLHSKNISYSAIFKLDQASYLIKLTDSGEVIISESKDLNKQVSSLQYILSRLTMEGKKVSRLDLRFDKPFVVSQ